MLTTGQQRRRGPGNTLTVLHKIRSRTFNLVRRRDEDQRARFPHAAITPDDDHDLGDGAADKTDPARGAFTGKTGSSTGKTSPTSGPRSVYVLLVEIVLTIVIALLLARLVYELFSPLPVPETLPVVRSDVRDEAASVIANAEVNPFRLPSAALPQASGEGAVALTQDLEETTLNLVLHGVFVDGGKSTAIIRTQNGEQKTFAIGDEVSAGVFLDGAYLDQVTISRNGVRETLSLINRDVSASQAARRSAATQNANVTSNAQVKNTPATAGDTKATSLTDIVQLAPRFGPNGVEVVLNPGRRGDAFRGAGLRPGDVLISVEGKRIGTNAENTAMLLRELAGRPSVSVILERDGVQLPLKIDLTTDNGAEDE